MILSKATIQTLFEEISFKTFSASSLLFQKSGSRETFSLREIIFILLS
jgi:hypothetical protein